MREFTTFDLKKGNAHELNRGQIQLPIFMLTHTNVKHNKKKLSNETLQAYFAGIGIVLTVASFMAIETYPIFSGIGMIAGVATTIIARYLI